MRIQIGEKAPDFELKNQEGKKIRLADLKGRSAVVLFFYPKDETPGCTKEACTFRDAYEEFKEGGAEVIGISSDSVDSHKNFASKYRIPFTLLSDDGGKVRKLFGVSSTWGLLPGRVTYLIDKEGVVRHIFSSQLQIGRHIREAKKMLAEVQR
ncbi:MAG: peroxiredoxin [Deltaproteobacteria bacterium]|nr:peroxiredoxin [Deltaproteobacteria bacterium]MBI4374109.1 peroxiredoxin [Deltaproteobacteria bacterium]